MNESGACDDHELRFRQADGVSSRSRLLEFVGEHLTFFAPGRSDIDPGRVAAEVKEIARRMEKRNVGLPAGIRLLNRTLRDFSQIEWICTLEELLQKNGNFPRRVRSWYRESRSLRRSAAPIQHHDRPEFIEGLCEYGL